MARFSGGWVKIWRSLVDHPNGGDATSVGFFTILIALANREPSSVFFKGQKTTLQPGDILTSRHDLAKIMGMAPSTVEDYLVRLQNRQAIRQQTDKCGRLITIVNWDTYQAKNYESDRSPTTSPTTSPTHNGEEGRSFKKKEELITINTCSRRSVRYEFSEVDLKAANWLKEQIKLHNPHARRIDSANPEEWANEVRLLRERDNLTHEEIAAVMRFALGDEFWQTHIQSPKKLRAKWDQLTAKMMQTRQIRRSGYRLPDE